jgi:hypothetical protein
MPLHSLRHIYAALELMKNSVNIYAPANRMGNTLSIEGHDSKLTATIAADRLA